VPDDRLHSYRADTIEVSTHVTLRARSWCLALGLCLAAACGGTAPPPPPTLDWLLGDWHGVRRDGGDGTEAPMTVHVVALSDGPGQVERVQVAADRAPYVGFAVRVPSGTSGHWVMLYTNATREAFARLAGQVGTDRVTWQSVTPGRSRDSRTLTERLDANRWRRTQRVSEDNGVTWRVLFTDELERDE